MESDAHVAYLRPETAQGIFANFKNVVDTGRVKIPVRHRPDRQELPQRDQPAELHLPLARVRADGDRVLLPARRTRPSGTPTGARRGSSGTSDLGLRSDRLRLRDHEPDELAFYSTATADIEYEFPFGISELEGIAHRGDYDLTQHQKFSGKDLSYFDEEAKRRYLPHVIEPSAGADRATLAFLCEAYDEDEVAGESRTVHAVPPAAGAGQGGGLSPGQEGRRCRRRPRRSTASCSGITTCSTTRRARSAGAIGGRTRRARRTASRSTGRPSQDETVTFRDRDTLPAVAGADGGLPPGA